MVNTLAVMHNLKGKQIDFTQAFPHAKFYDFQQVLNINTKNGH
jgi:hypothetical protein